jgi:hypothetical protein
VLTVSVEDFDKVYFMSVAYVITDTLSRRSTVNRQFGCSNNSPESIRQTAPVECLNVDWVLPCYTCVTEDTKVHVICSAFDRLGNIM